MALLAEHKRKVKHGLDPQNATWSNDSSKIGQRLMEKMGWEKGKGLGANENGITEHIKASYKSDTKGLGSTPQTADAWIAHQDDFNDLLKMLNSQSEADAPVEKTEKEKRVDGHKRYYGRFARGQVQTLRSTEDLNCIFGKRKSKSEMVEPNEHSATNSGCDDTEEDKRHGLTTVTSTSSVQEYFAKKMADMKLRKEVNIGQEGLMLGVNEAACGIGTDEQKKENKPSPYSAVSFSYNSHDSETGNEKQCRGWYNNFAKDNCSDGLQNVVTEKKSKRSKKEKRDNEDNDSNVEMKRTSSKKEKCDNEDNDSNVEMKRTSSKKDKVKLRDKHKTTEDSLSSGCSVTDSLELPPVSGDEEKKSDKRKKKEKKTKHKSASAEIECTDGTDEKSERKKKKSKREKINNCEDVIVDESLDTSSALTSRTKGNKKAKKSDNDINDDNVALSAKKTVNDNTEKQRNNKCDPEDTTPESDDGRKNKKKQKRKHSQMDAADEESAPVETNSKKKKKRRKDTNTDEPEDDTAGDINKDNENALSDEQKIHKDGAESKDVTHSPKRLKNCEKKLKEKERKRRKELKKAKQNALSNKLFPGSNVADIIGYGISPRKQDKKGKVKV